jgi:hypothetical protein
MPTLSYDKRGYLPWIQYGCVLKDQFYPRINKNLYSHTSTSSNINTKCTVKGHLNQNSKQIIYAHLKVFVCGLIFLGSIDQCVSFLWFIHFFVLCFFHVLLSMCIIFVREKCFYMLSLPPGSQFFFGLVMPHGLKVLGYCPLFFFCPFFLTFLVPSVQSLEFRIESTLFESHQINMMLQKQIDLPRQSNFNKPRSERSHASIC